MKMEEILKKEMENEMDKIQTPSSLYRFSENIKEEMKKVNDQNKIKPNNVTPFVKRNNRKLQFAAAVVLGLGILTGSIFLNPTMAEMASKIPYLGQVFNQKPVDQVIFEKLESEGYKELSIGSIPGKVIQYDILIKGTDEDANQERNKITGIVEDILKGRGYDNYKITVDAYMPEFTPLTEEEEKLTELGNILDKELKARGYDIIVANPFNSEIEVSIPVTEKRTEEIKAVTVEIAKANGSKKAVKLDIVDREANEREGLWMDYLRSINDGLAGKQEYHFKNYGYSYKNHNVKIFIKTTLSQTDPEAKETIEKIRKEIELFLSSDTVKKSKVGTDTYELHFMDDNDKEFQF